MLVSAGCQNAFVLMLETGSGCQKALNKAIFFPKDKTTFFTLVHVFGDLFITLPPGASSSSEGLQKAGTRTVPLHPRTKAQPRKCDWQSAQSVLCS